LKPSFTSESIQKRAVTPGPLRALFLGQVIPRKGLLTLIEAVALLPPGSVRLDIAGSSEADPHYARQVRRRVDVLRLDQAVRMLGVLDSEGVAQVMAEAHVLAVPSSYEGYGMAYLEGMGYGLPAIAGAGGGAAEFVRHEENGFLVTDPDPAALAVILSTLHSDRARLARLGISARSTYLAHPTWDMTGDAILTFLAGLVPRT
jgi:glycosyltransferase involved in cell wall biosynthesis